MNTQTTTTRPVDSPAAGNPAGTERTVPREPTELAAGPPDTAWLVQRVAALLEDQRVVIGPDPAALDQLAAAAEGAGLGTQRERDLLAGGTAELLITADHQADHHGGEVDGVAVVVAGHGATDALRGRLRRLGAHREIAAIVVATTRPRHRALTAEVRQVPVHVVVLHTYDRGHGDGGGGPG